MLSREKAVAHVATFLPEQGFACWQQFKIAHYDGIMQHHRQQFHFWEPDIPRDVFINWSIFDHCVKEICANIWVSVLPNIKASALSNLHHPKNTVPLQRRMKGDQFQRPWKPSAGELPGGWRKPPALSSHDLSYEQVNPLSKWLTLNFNIFSSCSPFLGFFHTCGFLLLEGTGHLLSNLLCSTPGCSECHRQWHKSVKMLQEKSHLSNLKEKKLVTAVVRWAAP